MLSRNKVAGCVSVGLRVFLLIGASKQLYAAEETAAKKGAQDSLPQRKTGMAVTSMLTVEAGAQGTGRKFDYSDPLTPNLRPYSVFPAAELSLRGELFPLAGTPGPLGDVGIVGSYSQSILLDSSMSGNAKLGTVDRAYSFGLQARIHPGGDRSPFFILSNSFAVRSVSFDSAGPVLDAQIPAVNYTADRLGGELRIPVANFDVFLASGFRFVVDAGDSGMRFRNRVVNGADAEVGVGMSVLANWEVRLSGQYERYFYSMTPVPGDAYVAGGALDQFYGGRLALAYVY